MTPKSSNEYCPELFEFSDKEKKVWRYMDLAKFISLLDCKEIYFVRGDRFEDKLEGSYSKPTIEKINQSIRIYLHLGGIQIFERELRVILNLINQINRLSVFISCWHMNEYESYAMWDLYNKDGKGIAIQSTVDKIETSLDTSNKGDSLNITAGKVHYLDFESEEFKAVPLDIQGLQSSSLSISIKALYIFLHKRISFSHEKEMRFLCDRSSQFNLDLPQEQLIKLPNQSDDHNLRAALANWQKILTEQLDNLKKNSTSLKVKIKPENMNTLIEKVYVSPRAQGYFNESLVKGIIKRYGLSCDVKKSDLSQDPLL
jgi:hypothetical protein